MSLDGAWEGKGPIVRLSGGRSRACDGKSIACSRIFKWDPGARRLPAVCSTSRRSGAVRPAKRPPSTSSTRRAYEITAELPGMNESDIDVKFSDGTLTIKGEKRDEKEENKKGYYLSERRYGSFQRSFGVPDGVDVDKIEANFKNGVLTVTLPKTPQAQTSEKKISIKKS